MAEWLRVVKRIGSYVVFDFTSIKCVMKCQILN